ncbi:MAG: T9SS C-terminal target domain-containing protein [Ignavibacteriales bacterium]|nr:MAG: T9SS C-terminal target domain-containing protein [Ignavibacteriales bacterium]
MKSKILLFLAFSFGTCFAQNFWEKTNFPSDNTSLYSVYSMITNTSDNVLAGTYAKGIFKSTDLGNTWTESGMTNQWIISFAKDNSGNIFTASIGSQFGSGVHKSTDQGSTWNKVWDALTGMNCVYVDQSGYIYVGLNYTSEQSGIYKSTDGGGNWVKIFSLAENVYSIIKTNSGRILAAGYGKVFYSDNEGTNWNTTTNGFVSFTPSAFAINNQGEVFLSTLGYGIYKTTDNGINWVNKTGAGWEYSSLIINSDGSMYAGTKGNWIYRSLNNGDNWELVKSGMGEDKYVLSLLTNSTGYLFAGMDYYGIYKSVNKVVTDIEEPITEIPEDFVLYSNYPNPFNNSTKISYEIPVQSNVSIILYDALGREVATLVNEVKPGGKHQFSFVEYNLVSGVYFYTLRAGNYTQTKKMILLK